MWTWAVAEVCVRNGVGDAELSGTANVLQLPAVVLEALFLECFMCYGADVGWRGNT
jgi:hypothetical protein